ncbi:pyridoxal phosphate-dependent aminotransferase [Hymenobacter pini]|uniref:pyridoxal phosphate-dependent aminotransferase n=1 Tax=Hymenobacter pini TaxID=2880879 RepID=UPI001CF4BB8E|nr:aminotransferase class I/II-fold pyridoxal phosphate-dependent enzyme [Hymenobacter pini]MCA8831019.1 aminotransferase class I/II-fold pyridoxal phosphate-dependent enzyme [Hymenobacter pini]
MADVLNLASGYGTFLTPAVAAEAAIRSIEAGQLPVVPAAGLPALQEAIARRYQQLEGTQVEPQQVVVTPGAKAALSALLTVLLRPGDEVLLPTPNWFGFGELITRAGGIVRTLPLSPDDNYALHPEQLRAAITTRTRVLLFSNPNNPTGRVYHREELAAMLAVTQDFPELYVLSDEIYDLLSFAAKPTPSLLEFPDSHGRHLVVNGFSKSLALIGWGIGYLIAPAEIAQQSAAYQHATGGSVAVPAQHAAQAVMQAAFSIASGLVSQLHRNRRLMLAHLASLPNVPLTTPEATYYAFPDLRAYLPPAASSAEASRLLVAQLRESGVEVVDGSTCGAPGFVRISYAVPEPVLQEALNRLSGALRLLEPVS